MKINKIIGADDNIQIIAQKMIMLPEIVNRINCKGCAALVQFKFTHSELGMIFDGQF